MEDKIKPAFLDAENVAFIDAKNARLDAQRVVIEELLKYSTELAEHNFTYFGPDANPNFNDSLWCKVKRLRLVIAKAKEIAK